MKTPRMEMQTPCGAFFVGGDLRADASIGPYRSENFPLAAAKMAAGGFGIRPYLFGKAFLTCGTSFPR